MQKLSPMEKEKQYTKNKTTEKNNNKYFPAFGYGFLTPIYDFIMKWLMRELTFKRRLIEQARIEKGHRVLDIGCGSATLTILIKKTHPETEVIGIDGDLEILEIAKSKVTKEGMDIALDRGMIFELPYQDESFDRVVSSMVFHHLTRENKLRTLKEVFRVLKAGGELHVVDFGKPQNAYMYLISLIMRRLEENLDNVKGLLLKMFRDAGFDHIEETARYTSIFGALSFYKARKPEHLSLMLHTNASHYPLSVPTPPEASHISCT